MKKNTQLVTWLESALMGALAFVLALIPFGFGFYEIELGMIPIIILAYRRGVKAGLTSGFIWGILKVLSGNIFVLTPLQVFLEYLFAFALSGLAGAAYRQLQHYIYHNNRRKTNLTIIWSVTLAVFSKYFIHFLAGIIFWSSYAPEGMSPIIYSLVVNGSAFVMTSLANTLILLVFININLSLIKIR